MLSIVRFYSADDVVLSFRGREKIQRGSCCVALKLSSSTFRTLSEITMSLLIGISSIDLPLGRYAINCGKPNIYSLKPKLSLANRQGCKARKDQFSQWVAKSVSGLSMVENVSIQILKPTDESINRLARRFIALADHSVLRVCKQLRREATTKYYTEKITRCEGTCFQDLMIW